MHLRTAIRVVRAAASNQLAKLMPGAYVRLTGQTGRGGGTELPEDVAAYFQTCVDDYFARLGVGVGDRSAFLAGKHLLEYGPGDLPGVAMLMYGLGATRVVCVDRFPMLRPGPQNAAVLQAVIGGLEGGARARAEAAFNVPGNIESGFRAGTVDYVVRPHGLSGLVECVDLVFSRAVLEHVDDLSATFVDMWRALKPEGIAVHQVDLKSHGLHCKNPLDFLAWSPGIWRLMYSAKGVPNRLRVDAYRREFREAGFECVALEPTSLANPEDVMAVRATLAECFHSVSDADLSWLGFWIVLRKPAADKSAALPNRAKRAQDSQV